MIDFYYWTTPNGHKVTMFLEEAGLGDAGRLAALTDVRRDVGGYRRSRTIRRLYQQTSNRGDET